MFKEVLLQIHYDRMIVSNSRSLHGRTKSSDSQSSGDNIDFEVSDNPPAVKIGLCSTDVVSISIDISQFTDNALLTP